MCEAECKAKMRDYRLDSGESAATFRLGLENFVAMDSRALGFLPRACGKDLGP